MQRRRAIPWIAASALLSIAFLAAAALGAPIYLEPKDIKPGVSGYGLTVFAGSEPSSFDFKVLAVTKGEDSSDYLIIARVSGPSIDEIGGIAAGMSGSPCYLSGKLIGALSHVLEGPDPFIGIITPMSAMVRLLEAGKLASAGDRIEIDGWVLQASLDASMVSGLAGRALDELKAGFRSKGYKVSPVMAIGASSSDEDRDGGYVAGSSIAVQMCNGDVEAGAIGTLTWTDGRSFLAFGHPMLNIGSVELPMSKSTVLAVLPSDSFPFKLGTFEAPSAVVTQDRSYGLAGTIGTTASMADVSVRANDMQTGRRKSSSLKCVRDERLMEDLVASAVLSTIDGSIMRVGEGTAYISVLIKTGSGQLIREDMVWSGNDIGTSVTGEVSDIIALILGNDVEEAAVSGIQVTVDIAPVRLTSVITGIELPEGGFVPGTPQSVGVRIRPFRGEEYTKQIEVMLPAGTDPGTVSVSAFGGASEDEDEAYTIGDKVGDTGGRSVSELLEDIGSADQNNEVVLEIYYEREGAQDEALPYDQGAEGEPYDGEPLYRTSVIIQSVVKGFVSEESEVK